MINSIVFLMAVSTCSWLVHGNTIAFCIVILYLVTLPKSFIVLVFCRFGGMFNARLSSIMLNLSHETQRSCFVVAFFLIFQILSFYHFFHVWRTSFSYSLRGSLNLFYKNQSRALAISLHTVCSSFPAGTDSWRAGGNVHRTLFHSMRLPKLQMLRASM